MLRRMCLRVLFSMLFASLPLALSAQQIHTFLSFTTSTNSVVIGQPFTLTATLGVVADPTKLAGTNGLPVNFVGLSGGCTATLQNGVASCQATEVQSPMDGPGYKDEIFAVFNGNATYASSSSDGPIDISVYAPGSNVGPALKGAYAFYFDGYTEQPGGAAKRVAAVGSLMADGVSKLSGTLDYNASTESSSKLPVTGTYTINTAGQGTIILTSALFTLHFDLFTGVPVTTGVQSATMMESDGYQLFGTGRLHAQTLGSPPGSTAPGTIYNFHLAGETACTACQTDGHASGAVIAAGALYFGGFYSTSSTLLDAALDETIGTDLSQRIYPNGQYTQPDASGRMTLNITYAGEPADQPTNFVAYVVHPNKLFVMSTDPHSKYILLLGEADQ